MGKIRAAITGIHAWVPEYRLNNFELSRMVETSDEWIMQRVGIKERRILKEEGLGTSDLGEQAVKGLLVKTKTSPDEIDLLICATVTPDMQFPATANIISDKVGIKNAFSFDLGAACSGFLFALMLEPRALIFRRAGKTIFGENPQCAKMGTDERDEKPRCLG